MPSSINIEDTKFLFITDRNRSKGRSNIEVVRAAIKGGCKWVQYREPDLSDRDFYNECLKIHEVCAEAGVGLIVNDRLDIAALIRAEGLHVGANDLPVRVVKEFAGDDFMVGYSAHSVEEAVTAAWEGADYITYSPIFPLEHKNSPHKPHGIEGAREALKKVTIPVFFLGGIRLPDLRDLAKTIQPIRVATVGMISEAENITQTVEEALEILNRPV
jgi:thiamine-phosphate pyrophosphorylase